MTKMDKNKSIMENETIMFNEGLKIERERILKIIDRISDNGKKAITPIMYDKLIEAIKQSNKKEKDK